MASQLISSMICMNYYNNKMFGLLQFHSGYGHFYLNSPKGYCRKIINAQTGSNVYYFGFMYTIVLSLWREVRHVCKVKDNDAPGTNV